MIYLKSSTYNNDTNINSLLIFHSNVFLKRLHNVLLYYHLNGFTITNSAYSSFFLFKILCLAIRLSVYGCFFLRTFKHDAHCTLIAFYIPVLLSKFAITILSLKYCNFEPIVVYLINVFAELYSGSDAYIKKVFY